MLGTGGFLGLSDGSSGEKLGLDAWLELCGGCVGHLLLLLLRWLNCHLLSSDLKETPVLTLQLFFFFFNRQSLNASHLLLHRCLSLLRLACFLLGSGCSSCCLLLLLLLYLQELLNLHLGEGRRQDWPTWKT